MSSPVVLTLPFTGRWLVRNSPARRVPSHGTDLLGQRYVIDFVGVDSRHRTASTRDWPTFLASEPPERFVGFGRPILAPCDGVVVGTHDGEPDHAARRSPLSLVPYALGQAGRLREGIGAVAGNQVTIEQPEGFVTLVHLKAGSLRVEVGAAVIAGQQIAECGNSGNSTQPHVHVQVTDGPDFSGAQGVPMAFHDFREWAGGRTEPTVRQSGVPGEAAVVEPLPASDPR